MLVEGKPYRTIFTDENAELVKIIDQRFLPFEFRIAELRTLNDAADAIRDMAVRGAPLIGVTAAYGLYLALLSARPESWKKQILDAAEQLIATRPTAVNLKYAVDLMLDLLVDIQSIDKARVILREGADRLANEEVERSRKIGENGLRLIRELYERIRRPVQILTHCNAGWLACVDYGTATAPVYLAQEEGIPMHIWVDETRPRNQGARLTAWELKQQGISHTVIVDNAGGQLMQEGKVDLVIVGSDRTTRKGDVANKIGTYLKALAAYDNKLPFYVALPTSSIDMKMEDAGDMIIEDRGQEEVSHISGWDEDKMKENTVRILPEGAEVANPGFDITPGRLVTGLITEKGICKAEEKEIREMFRK